MFRYYGGWTKSLFSAACFDSYRGEYLIAGLLDKSPDIFSWNRLYQRDNAYISYREGHRYCPDFIAVDSSGIH